MSPARKQRARDKAGEWLDTLIPPSLQRTLVSAVTVAVLGALGLKLESNGEKAEKVVASVDEIVSAISNMQERAYTERRKSWTLSNDLARIEAKVDALIERASR